jgi:hypothetical protein
VIHRERVDDHSQNAEAHITYTYGSYSLSQSALSKPHMSDKYQVTTPRAMIGQVLKRHSLKKEGEYCGI